MKRDLEPITRSSRMIEAVSVGDRYSLGGSHGQAAAYPKHVHARACVTPRWRVRSNNARRNTRLYDNEAASPKLMPVYYEARPVEIDRDTFDWMPPRPNTIWLPRSAEWKFKSSRRLPVMDGLHYHPNRGARQFSKLDYASNAGNLGQIRPAGVRFPRSVDLSRSNTTERNKRVGTPAGLWCIVAASRLRCSHIFSLPLTFLSSPFNSEAVVVSARFDLWKNERVRWKF